MSIYKFSAIILLITIAIPLASESFKPIIIAPVSCTSCDYVIEPDQYLVDNDKLKLPPGAILGIKGKDRKPIKLINFHGTESKPFVIINCDGQATITSGTVGIKIHKSSHLRVTGTGSQDDYGIKISTRLHGVQAERGATDFEIDHVEIANARSSGLVARSNPEPAINRDNFVQKNTLIHDNYIHDVGNEGIYVGGSHWQDQERKEPELIGVRIYNNHVEDTGFDGIQVGSAIRDSEIYSNVVVNYGLRNSTYHQAGLQINPGTTGKIYNNYIKGGTGVAIFLSGFGNDVYNNLILDCNKFAIYIADRKPLPNQSYRIFNNTMVNINRAAVKMTSELSINNIFYNNVIVNAAAGVLKDSNMDLEIANNFRAASISEALFTDPRNLDFSPSEKSPLVDSGIDLTKIGNIEINRDYLFNQRKMGEKIDIGAFEFQKHQPAIGKK